MPLVMPLVMRRRTHAVSHVSHRCAHPRRQAVEPPRDHRGCGGPRISAASDDIQQSPSRRVRRRVGSPTAARSSANATTQLSCNQKPVSSAQLALTSRSARRRRRSAPNTAGRRTAAATAAGGARARPFARSAAHRNRNAPQRTGLGRRALGIILHTRTYLAAAAAAAAAPRTPFASKDGHRSSSGETASMCHPHPDGPLQMSNCDVAPRKQPTAAAVTAGSPWLGGVGRSHRASRQ